MNQLTQSLEREGSSHFCIPKQRSCVLGKALGSCMACYSAKADCWLWLHGEWLRETVQGA
jgi:hypothetical protein